MTASPTIPTTFATQKTLTNPDKYVLNGNFRCDRCGAQAYVKATFHNGHHLLFCAHHARKHEVSILPYLSEWYSETVRLEGENRLVGSEN